MQRCKPLRRLSKVFPAHPIYFITTCTHNRRRLLASQQVHVVLREEWESAPERHGWIVGRYVVMPDHVHFFAQPRVDAKSLSDWMQAWKEWTSKRVLASNARLRAPIWQKQFFDHVLRSGESYSEKWNYVYQNPVRAKLVIDADAWEFAGEVVTFRY